MPRNSSGTYVQPAGTAGVPGEVIRADPYNDLIADIGNEITGSLPTNGSKGMAAPIAMNGNKITLMADPSNPQDAVTKNYADANYVLGSQQSVFFGGTSTGAANAQVLASTLPANFSLTVGNRIVWMPGYTNTGALTLAVTSPAIPATAVRKMGPAGAVALTGGEVVAGQPAEAIYDGTQLVLVNSATIETGPLTTLAAAATTDIGTIGSRNVSITAGTGPITSFGSTATTAFPLYIVTWATSVAVTYDGTNLQIPGGASVTPNVGDVWILMALGGGKWKVLVIYPAATLLTGVTVPKRQTVLSGPTDATGLPNFWPATSGTLTIAMQNVSAVSPLTVTAANGFSSAGAQDLIAQIASNLSLTVGGSTTTYVHYDFDTPGLGTTTTPWIFQMGGTPSTASGQHTYIISLGLTYLGNGSTATVVRRTLIGEITSSASAITSAVCYAYQRRYHYQDTGNLPGSSTTVTKACNLGIHASAAGNSLGIRASLGVYVVTTTNGVPAGSTVYGTVTSAVSGGSMNITPWTDGMSVSFVTGSSTPWIINGGTFSTANGHYVLDVTTDW